MLKSKTRKAIEARRAIAQDFDMKPVLERYAEEQKVSLEEAERVAVELKRFLILCATFPARPYGLRSDKVDAMWHTFLLYTERYEAFCHALTEPEARFLHHHPCNTEKGATYSITYDGTWADYRKYFGFSPPDDIWPQPRYFGQSWSEINSAIRKGRRKGAQGGVLFLAEYSIGDARDAGACAADGGGGCGSGCGGGCGGGCSG